MLGFKFSAACIKIIKTEALKQKDTCRIKIRGERKYIEKTHIQRKMKRKKEKKRQKETKYERMKKEHTWETIDKERNKNRKE